jgi:hypothetical protein
LRLDQAEFLKLATRGRDSYEQKGEDQDKFVTSALELWRRLIEVESFLSPQPVESLALLKSRLEQYCRIDRAIKDERTPSREPYRRRLNNALQSLGDKDRIDTWPICELLGLDGDMKDDEPFGFVIVLRQFSILPVLDVRVKRSDWKDDPQSLLRICRLRGVYKTDLLQRFANLFVRVGVEDERLDMHKRMFQRVAAKLIADEHK